MIYTVAFNPAIDYVVRIEKLEIGSVNRSREEALFYGGKGINVSTVLKNLGVDSVALGFVAGFTGKAIEEGVAALGVKADFITVSDGVSRINVKLKAGEETEINGKGPNISDAELEELYKKLDGLTDGDCLVLAGAIPPSLPSDVYEKIMARLAGKKVDIVVDATKDLLLNVLKYHPFLIKPNNFELGEMFGVTLHSDEEIEEYAKKNVEHPELREAHKALAREIITFLHGKEEYERAEKLAQSLFNNEFKNLTKQDISDLFDEQDIKDVESNISLVDMLVKVGAASSKREAREFTQSGAVSINGEKITDVATMINDNMFIDNTYIIIKRGKKNYYIGRK